MSKQLQVHVRWLAGKDLGTFAADSGDSVKSLKDQIQRRCGTLPREQRLIMGTNVLENSTTLHASGLTDSCELHLVQVRATPAMVAAILRPMNAREKTAQPVGSPSPICTNSSDRTVSVQVGTDADGAASCDRCLSLGAFDAVFDESATQEQVFDSLMAERVDECVAQGISTTVITCGHAGSGKSFVMRGIGEDEHRGVMPRSFDRIFEQIEQVPEKQFLVFASFVDFYMSDGPMDLLDKHAMSMARASRPRVRMHPKAGSFFSGLSHAFVKSPADLKDVLEMGMHNFCVNCTHMERSSSHSSLLFTVTVVSTTKGKESLEESDTVQVATLQFADLAEFGSRPSAGKSMGRGLKTQIDALERVVSACAHDKHVPYRDSQLTLTLQDALRGRVSLLALAACSPAEMAVQETLHTLRFAEALKQVINFPNTLELSPEAFAKVYSGFHLQQSASLAPIWRKLLDLDCVAEVTTASAAVAVEAPPAAAAGGSGSERENELQDVPAATATSPEASKSEQSQLEEAAPEKRARDTKTEAAPTSDISHSHSSCGAR